METSDIKQIVERLKIFMNYTGLSISEFADNANISRSTLSQLLHFRPKSISDQILRKLKQSYPNLDISWLLFGQGDMLTSPNFKISERQNGRNIPNQGSYSSENEDDGLFAPQISEVIQSAQSEKNRTQRYQNNQFASQFEANIASNVAQAFTGANYSRSSNPNNTEQDASIDKTDQSRKIQLIIVLYNDSHIETFTPSTVYSPQSNNPER